MPPAALHQLATSSAAPVQSVQALQSKRLPVDVANQQRCPSPLVHACQLAGPQLAADGWQTSAGVEQPSAMDAMAAAMMVERVAKTIMCVILRLEDTRSPPRCSRQPARTVNSREASTRLPSLSAGSTRNDQPRPMRPSNAVSHQTSSVQRF
jgi:hypothetical protein